MGWLPPGRQGRREAVLGLLPPGREEGRPIWDGCPQKRGRKQGQVFFCHGLLFCCGGIAFLSGHVCHISMESGRSGRDVQCPGIGIWENGRRLLGCRRAFWESSGSLPGIGGTLLPVFRCDADRAGSVIFLQYDHASYIVLDGMLLSQDAGACLRPLDLCVVFGIPARVFWDFARDSWECAGMCRQPGFPGVSPGNRDWKRHRKRIAHKKAVPGSGDCLFIPARVGALWVQIGKSASQLCPARQSVQFPQAGILFCCEVLKHLAFLYYKNWMRTRAEGITSLRRLHAVR